MTTATRSKFKSALLQEKHFWWEYSADIRLVDGSNQHVNGSIALPALTPKRALVAVLDRFPDEHLVSFSAKRSLPRESSGE